MLIELFRQGEERRNQTTERIESFTATSAGEENSAKEIPILSLVEDKSGYYRRCLTSSSWSDSFVNKGPLLYDFSTSLIGKK